MAVEKAQSKQDKSIQKEDKKSFSNKKRAQDKAQDLSKSLTTSGDIEAIRAAVNTQIKANVAQEVCDKPTIVIPSGILSMDLAVGNGGLVGGRVMDIFGWEGTGKTLMCMTIGGYIQRCTKVDPKSGKIVPKTVAFLDAEGTFNRQFAISAGMDPDKVILVQSTPEKLMTGEDFFNAMKILLMMGVDYTILDSCPALLPSQALVNDIGQGQKATVAQLLSEGIKMSSSLAAATGQSLIHYINQKRGRPMAGPYQKSEIETGGNALKFYSSYRFEVVGAEDIEKNVLGVDGQYRNKKVGVNSKVRIIKNKTCPIPPYLASTSFHFDFDVYFEEFRDDEGLDYIRGVDVVKDFVETGVRAGVIKQQSSWFSFGSLKGNGKASLIKQIKENPTVLNEIRGEVFQAMGINDESGMSRLATTSTQENVA